MMENQIPQLRFPEFTGEWKNKKLGDVFSIFNGYAFPSKSSEMAGIRWVKIADVGIQEMRYNNLSFLPFSFSISHKKFLLKKGDYVVALTRPILNGKLKIAQVNSFFDGALLNQRVGRIDSVNSLPFIYSLLQKDELIKLIESNIAGSDPPNLSPNEINSIFLNIPSLPEQTKIATFLTAVDEKLTALKQKKTLLAQYKKVVIEKIFSQELRFKDDNGNHFADWEERTLGEIYTFKTTNSFSRENLNYESGEVKNIHYGDIHTKFQSRFDILNEKVPFINSEISIQRILDDNYCKEGDLVIADASEDYADIGKSIEIVNLNSQKTLAGLHTLLARPDLEKISLGFGSCFMKSEKMRSQIMKIAQGSKVLSISVSRMKNVGIELPLKQEQTKIANFLSAIDDKLNHCNNEIAQTETWKKGLLQQLFVKKNNVTWNH